MWGWSRGCTPPLECCRVPHTYIWATWHQTRAFLITVNNKRDFSGWFDNSKKGEVSVQIEWMGGWSRGCTPPKECCRLPPTYFWTTWHQTRAFLIPMYNKSDFSGWFDNSKNGEVSGQIEWMGGWSRGCTPPKLRNATEYRLPTFKPHGTKLGHSWFQWFTKSDFSGWFDNSEKGEVSGQIEWTWGWSRGCTPPQECCRVPHTYLWATWHQTRAFLISVNNKSDFSV